MGISTGGALDRAALILGNRLVGNEPSTAALEITLVGPEIYVTASIVIALTGADLGATLDGKPFPMWQPIIVPAGGVLSFHPHGNLGARAYLCVAGGIAIEPVLGSRSTDLSGGFGGIEGRPLQANDILPIGQSNLTQAQILQRRIASALPVIAADITVRVVLGPQTDRFTSEALDTFFGQRFTVSIKSNRIGVRLTGPTIAHRDGADMLSEGIASGAIQIPGDGQPIVLLAARQTIGGYTKIATVIGADLDRFAQLRPGDGVRFVAIDLTDARTATLAYWASLDANAVIENPLPRKKRSMKHSTAWTPKGVVKVIEAAQTAGVSKLRIKIPGLTLVMRRDAGGTVTVTDSTSSDMPTPTPTPTTLLLENDTIAITAPVIGVLYRRRNPDEAPLAEPGQLIEQGDPIAVLDVMKTYHDILATHTGILETFLVEDGQFVEFGQPIATMKLGENQTTAVEE